MVQSSVLRNTLGLSGHRLLERREGECRLHMLYHMQPCMMKISVAETLGLHRPPSSTVVFTAIRCESIRTQGIIMKMHLEDNTIV